MEFFQVDVFADAPYLGNPLAVFPDAGDLSARQMQAIAREMNLSETIFVLSIDTDTYEARIFTPASELPFAGHPTIGCAWLLFRLDRISGDTVTQLTSAGPTPLSRQGEELWFSRRGSVGDPADLELSRLAELLGVGADDLTLRWRDVELQPAIADAGVTQLIVPVIDLATLQEMSPPPTFADDRYAGALCFTKNGDEIRARGFFPDVGVPEDPATGSAVAALGLYLDSHIGEVDTTVIQGAEIGRPSTIRLTAAAGETAIGGACRLILKGELQALP